MERFLMTANIFMIGTMLWWFAENDPLIALAATLPLAIMLSLYERSREDAGMDGEG
jgi:hypothetical protein